MKRALAARAKHDPSGLAQPIGGPIGGPMAGNVVTSSPPQPPLKMTKFENNQDEGPRGSEISHQMTTEPIRFSSSQPVLQLSPTVVPVPMQQPTEKNASCLEDKTQPNLLPTGTAPKSMDQGTANNSKSKNSMKRQRSSQSGVDDEDQSDENSAFFLKHQNAALASELQQLRYQLQLLEAERDFRRKQCQDACQALHSLEATWNAMEVALQLGQQPPDDHEDKRPERTKSLPHDTPRSTGTGESVELIGALLDSLAAIGKEADQSEGSNEEIQLRDIRQTAESVSARATALQRWIWGLLRKITAEDDSGKHPLLKLAKLEAKLSALKAQVRDFQTQIGELAKCRDDAVESERRVRRGLYRLNAGRMKLEEVIKAIETDGKDGSNALMALEENARAPSAQSAHTDDEEVVDSSQIAELRIQIRDLEEISASREQQIEELTKQREENQRRINDLALPSEVDKLANDKELSEDDIRVSDLFTDTWTRMTTSERQLEEVQLKLAQTRENWSASRSDAEYATKSLEEHLMKHKKRWAELTDSVETDNGHEEVIKSEIVVQAEMIVELNHKLNQALENVRRADVVRASLEEISQLNTALQSRMDEMMTKNELLSANSTTAAVPRPETPLMKDSVDDEKLPPKAEITNIERVLKEHRRLRKDLTATIQSKENAKAKLEKSEKERETLIKTNSRLVKQSAEKDEMNAKSLSTILHLKSVTEKLKEEIEVFEQQMKSSGQVNLAARLAANAKERVTDEVFNKQKEFEEKVYWLEQQCDKVKADYDTVVGSLEAKKAEMSILEKDAANAKGRCDELVAELTKQEAEKRKILETLAIAQREAGDAAKMIARMRTKGGGGGSDSAFTTEQLNTQITVLKSRLACPVCNHRDKSCIVLRCRHMFCRHCMDENIKNRNRKCPSCGQRFDTKDVEDIWL